jgi:hypothetical protein
MLGGNSTVGHIQNSPVASADCCAILALQKHEAALTRLRREQYPHCDFLYDNPHDRRPDPKAELDYSRSKVWSGYYAKIENLESRRTELAYRRQTLIFAVIGLSYDLAVVQANDVIDRGLRGEEAARAYREEAALLLKEVSSARRVSCERLGLSSEDTEGLKDLAAQAFDQVHYDFQRLLAGLPMAPARTNGRRFRQIRVDAKLQKEEVGRASTIDRIEKNIPVKPTTLDAAIRKLAQLLHKTPRDLKAELEAD